MTNPNDAMDDRDILEYEEEVVGDACAVLEVGILKQDALDNVAEGKSFPEEDE